jgi:hypothetical protein
VPDERAHGGAGGRVGDGMSLGADGAQALPCDTGNVGRRRMQLSIGEVNRV